MPDLSDAVKGALARYWSEIRAAATEHKTTADLYASIRQRAADLGLPSVGIGAQAISVLRGYAGRIQAAADAFNNALDSAPMQATYLPQTPWSRSLNEQAMSPVYNVVFQHQIQTDDGSVVTKYQTIVIPGALPDTVGEMRDYILSEAAMLAAEGGAQESNTPHGQSIDVTDVSIQVV